MQLKLALIQARLSGLRSTIHNEKQLSMIELNGMLAKKTNEIIDVLNELTTEIDQLLNDINKVLDTINGEVV